MRLTTVFLFFTLFTFQAFSLETFAVEQKDNPQIDQDLFQSKIASIEEEMKFNPKESAIHLEELYNQCKNESNIKNQLVVAKLMTRVNSRTRNIKALPSWYKKVDSLLALTNEDQLDLAFEMSKVQYYVVSKRNAEALTLLRKIKASTYETGDTTQIINWLCRNAGAYNSTEYIDSALTYYLKAQELNRTYNNESCQAMITLVHGNILWEKHDPEASIKEYLEASKYFEKVEDFTNLIPLYRNIVSDAMNMNQEELAIEYSDKISELQRKYSSDIGYFTGEINKIFFLITLDKYQEAVDYADKTIALADSLERDDSHAIYLKGVAYRGLKRYDLAIPQIEEAYTKAVEINHNGKITFYSHALYQTYLWDKQFENALTWHETYTGYKDSVYNEKNRKEVEVLNARYETVQSKMEFEKLTVRAELNNQKKKQYIGLLLFGLFIGATLLYAQIQRRKKSKQLHKAEIELKDLEEKRLKEELVYKNRELTTKALHVAKKNEVLQRLRSQLEVLAHEKGAQECVREVVNTLKLEKSIDGNWDQFTQQFTDLNPTFYKELIGRFPGLTKSELRLAALLRMNLSSKEIANMLNISDSGVKKARQRIRKKLELQSEESLETYILSV